MISTYFKTTSQTKLRQIEEYKPGSWINVFETTDEDLENISKLVNLSVADLRDSLDDYEVPRIERQDENIIVFLRTPELAGKDLYTETLTVIINPLYFITISAQRNDLIQKIKGKKIKVSTTQRSKFLIYLLTRIGNEFTIRVKKVSANVRRQKSEISVVDHSDIVSLVENEEVLNQYLAALIPMRNVFEQIITGDYIKLYDEDSDGLHDMINSIKQSVDVCTVNLKSTLSLRDAYQIIFTNRLNQTIKFLTSITIIITIPTLISSIYGMNIDLPLSNNASAFPMIMGIAAIISIILLVIFYWRRWL